MTTDVKFDGKLIRNVKFTKEFVQTLKKSPSGAVIVFLGSELSSVGAVNTLLAGLRVQKKYHDAKDVLLGVISWNNSDSGLYSAFRFSMETFQAVGFGYLDVEFGEVAQEAKNLRFRLWLKQSVKRRALRGQTTVIAMTSMDEKAVGKFFGSEVISQYGVVVKTSEVLEGCYDKESKGKGGKHKTSRTLRGGGVRA